MLVEWKERALAFFVQRLRLNAKIGRWGSEGAAQEPQLVPAEDFQLLFGHQGEVPGNEQEGGFGF